MTSPRDNDYLVGLVNELCKLPHETEWVEFKVNNSNPQEIGEYISALSNAAALNGKAFGYLVWGVEDGTHAIVGTGFSPSATKKGNEPLETWLLRLVEPRIHFRFFELTVDGKALAVLEIGRAFRHPVRFKKEAFIRIGQVKKPLREAPDRERELWRLLDRTLFEEGVAAEWVSSDEVLRLLDYPAYFDLLEQPLPTHHTGILEALSSDNLIHACDAGGWDITNLGAILFAKKLSDFPQIKRKSLRVIQYRGIDRTETLEEKECSKGYANDFVGLIDYINNLLPSNEVMGKALRKTVTMFPGLAVRELVANALIHQDFHVTGAGPMVEIFLDRIEITNPGEPLVDIQRFVDTPPRSRNEVLASMMRRFRICEERGSGIDKVISQVELFQLPAPVFEVPSGFTRIILFSYRPLAEMDKVDRIRAVYQHACLRYVNRQHLVNASVRERFGIATASRLIRDALESGMIHLVNEDAADKLRAYVPFWA